MRANEGEDILTHMEYIPIVWLFDAVVEKENRSKNLSKEF